MPGLINQAIPEQPRQPSNGPLAAPGVMREDAEVAPQAQTIFNRYEINTMNMLYDGKPFEKFVQILDKNKPVGSVALAASKLLNESRRATVQKGGQPVTPEMTAKIANMAVGELATIAETANMFSLNDEQKRKALDLVIGSEYKKDIKKGVIDPAKYKQFLQQSGALNRSAQQATTGGQQK